MKIYVEQEKESASRSKSFLDLAKDPKNHNKVSKILEKLEKYIISKESIVDVYSKEGIYQVNENQTYKLHVKSEKTHENIVLKKSDDEDDDDKIVTLVIDDSIIQKDLVHQLPYDHINIPLSIHKYSLNKNKNNKLGLMLVIEFIENKDSKGNNLKPINYYFEYGSEIGHTNNLPTEDINVFLSLLN
jgi:hypothetical protein